MITPMYARKTNGIKGTAVLLVILFRNNKIIEYKNIKKRAYKRRNVLSQNPSPTPVRISIIPSPIPICQLLNLPIPIIEIPTIVPKNPFIMDMSLRKGRQINNTINPGIITIIEILLVFISFILEITNMTPRRT